jgi:Flp pilus assembly pilin Flp
VLACDQVIAVALIASVTWYTLGVWVFTRYQNLANHTQITKSPELPGLFS